ncbi:YdeI/OmpD-associated family protein [Reichenbachiella versicolor]|uniref:YdeI/OmpD-associated family protein n=1 Tax=Reichenbachiella versicolor TaxID=1821036 RepID=UPI000D6E940B|nr:YdeI/OmpD-associated family protein [Reichenbachiella versicolor]
MTKSGIIKDRVLKKFPGKGGWTYAEVPEIMPSSDAPFGWVTVSGYIDEYELKKIKLLPMGDGKLFLPVKSMIRKKINKEAGDTVLLQLFIDNTPVKVPKEIYDCLSLIGAEVKRSFDELNDSSRKAYVDWIYEAKSNAVKEKRIAKMIQDLE